MSHQLISARVSAAIQLSFIADSLAMPVHWFYNPQDIYAAFPGGITRFEAAPAFHPSSIMNLHSTNAGGRGAQHASNGPQVVGDIILKGKRQYWGVANQHYHRGMAAGENTLNLHCMRMVMRGIQHNQGRYDPAIFLRDYIAFMTAETPQHPDTYAESYHRGFFANFAKGRPAEKCGAVTHDTASVGGLVTVAPIAIAELLHDRSLSRVQDLCRTHILFTHPDEHLGKICDAYVALIDALLFRTTEDGRGLIAATAKQAAGIDVQKLAQQYHDDNRVVGGKFSRACYIEDSWPGVLYLAWKYCADPKQGLIANANLGGDNCHRGAVLGVILGLATANGLDNVFAQLTDAAAIRGECLFESNK
ncbi:ADP-ribosylglycohydrolase family protein [Cellvibrio fibrivorans]|uniref:ADP-ribosylglycohydrolase n=1 Tax=Cellvibrio fibrivorans TaxID=126350 RepID=A0ABU1UV10_9GAMM|nr:ADP-ribosylglycohydrolase family protein [Cellvibrio fibrivorans]MDR7089043.1 ADP-ribosylglycohydrolase [Cellvibrio fibrivorans]